MNLLLLSKESQDLISDFNVEEHKQKKQSVMNELLITPFNISNADFYIVKNI
jgi:hypothetical protein